MSHNTVFARIKWIILLLLMMLLDTLPVPVLGFVLLYVLLFRPLWFKHAVQEIYDPPGRTDRKDANDLN